MSEALGILNAGGTVPWQVFKTRLNGLLFELVVWSTSDGVTWFSMYEALDKTPVIEGLPVTLGTDLLGSVQWNSVVRGLHITPTAMSPGATATDAYVGNGTELIIDGLL